MYEFEKNKPNAIKTSELDREKRNARIVELATSKTAQYSSRDITKILNSEGYDIGHSSVYGIIRKERALYREFTKEKIVEHTNQMVAELDMLIDELWHQYFKSANPTETTIAYLANKSEGAQENTGETSNVGVVQKLVKKQEKKPTNDIGILAQIRSTMDMKARILGLYAPTEVKAEVKQATDMVGKVMQMSDADLVAFVIANMHALPANTDTVD